MPEQWRDGWRCPNSEPSVLIRTFGKRDSENTDLFIRDLRERVLGTPEISTDGFHPYRPAIRDAFGERVAHGTRDPMQPRRVAGTLFDARPGYPATRRVRQRADQTARTRGGWVAAASTPLGPWRAALLPLASYRLGA
jgi:hypothetical protein